MNVALLKRIVSDLDAYTDTLRTLGKKALQFLVLISFVVNKQTEIGNC